MQKQPVQSSENEEKIQVLNSRITEMLENIEKLGSEGEVEQAQSLMKLSDQLKEERELLQSQKGGVSFLKHFLKNYRIFWLPYF